MKIDPEIKIRMYEILLLIRESEWKMVLLYKKGELPGHVLPCLGQEAIPAGFSAILKKKDYLITGHRGAGHYIARGGSLKRLWAELYGRRKGILGGKGGQMHLADMNVKTIAGNAIVGSNWVIGCGAAFAAKQNKRGSVAAVFGGEASTNRGTFHEALNMAALKKLPVVFTVEFNNKQLWDENSYVTAVKDLANRAIAHDIRGINCDGNDPESVFTSAFELVQSAREGNGPSLLICKTFKWMDSGANQRQTDKELKEGKEKFDPVRFYSRKLIEEGIIGEKKEKELREKARTLVEEAANFGKNSPLPCKEDTYTNVFTGIVQIKER